MTQPMTIKPNWAATSPIEKRMAKRAPDFRCKCGEEWMTPGHMFWVTRMYCACGEIVEAGANPEDVECE